MQKAQKTLMLRTWLIAILGGEGVCGFVAPLHRPPVGGNSLVHPVWTMAAYTLGNDAKRRLQLSLHDDRRAGTSVSRRGRRKSDNLPSHTYIGHAIGSPIKRALKAAQMGNATLALAVARASLARDGAKCSVRECNQLLRVLGDSGHIDAMITVYNAMVDFGAQPTQVTYGTLISRAGACHEPQLASRMYREMLRRGLQPDAQTLNSLMNAYSKAGHVNRAFAAAAVMRKLGVTPTLVTYNTLLDACARGGNVSLAYETLRELDSAALRPNARTYSILIHLCARARLENQAFSWFRRMVAAGEAPNAVTYSTLINACGRAGKVEQAFAVLEQMRGAGLQPNVVTYTALIDACAKGRQLSRALEVFRAMITAGVSPNRITCTALFHGCLTAGEVLLAREVVQHMHTVGLKPSAHSFTALLTATTKLDASQQHSAAVACLLRQMATASTPATEIGGSAASDDREVGGTIMVGSSPVPLASSLREEVIGGIREILGDLGNQKRAGRVQQAIAVLDTLISARLRPPTALWHALFDAVDTSLELQAAAKRFERARQVKLAPDRGEASEALVRATSRVWEPASSANTARRDSSIGYYAKHTSGSYEINALDPGQTRRVSVQPFLAETRLGAKPPEALQAVYTVFTEMRASGIAPDLAAFNALINACASVGDVPRAEGAFGELCAAGLTPDAISYTCIIKACAVAGDAARAERIYLEMQQRTNHFSTYTPPSSHTYKHLMAVHAQAGAPLRTLELFNELRTRGLAPTHTHFALALTATTMDSALPDSLGRAQAIYKDMRAAGFRLDTRTLLALAVMCKAHGDAGERFASQMRRERSLFPRE